MNIYIFYSIFFLMPFLHGKQRHPAFAQNDDVDSIIAYKLQSNASYPKGVECTDIKTHYGIVKFNLTTFKNRVFFDMSNKSAYPGAHEIDARSLVEIWYHSGKIDTLCTCTLPCMSINSEMFELGSDLNYLLDSLYLDWHLKNRHK